MIGEGEGQTDQYQVVVINSFFIERMFQCKAALKRKYCHCSAEVSSVLIPFLSITV